MITKEHYCPGRDLALDYHRRRSNYVAYAEKIRARRGFRSVRVVIILSRPTSRLRVRKTVLYHGPVWGNKTPFPQAITCSLILV